MDPIIAVPAAKRGDGGDATLMLLKELVPVRTFSLVESRGHALMLKNHRSFFEEISIPIPPNSNIPPMYDPTDALSRPIGGTSGVLSFSFVHVLVSMLSTYTSFVRKFDAVSFTPPNTNISLADTNSAL